MKNSYLTNSCKPLKICLKLSFFLQEMGYFWLRLWTSEQMFGKKDSCWNGKVLSAKPAPIHTYNIHVLQKFGDRIESSKVLPTKNCSQY